MEGRLTATEGVVSVIASPATRVDAACAGNHAGIELALTEATVTIGENTSYRDPLTLSIALTPAVLGQVLEACAEAKGLPAFTEPEWRAIADVLDTSAAAVPRELAARIRAVYTV